MRLLHVDFDDLEQPWGGGQARRTWEIGRRLAARGWGVTVVTGSYPGARPRDLAVENGWLRYRRAGFGRFPVTVLSFLASLPILARTLPHDLLVEDFTTPVGPALCPWWTRRPVVGSAQFLFAGEMARKYRLPFDKIERRALRAYRWLVALAEGGAAHLRSAAAQAEVAVIPQGLDDADFVPPGQIDGNGEYALYLGRLDVDQKGLDVLLEAWRLLPSGSRPLLLIAGAGRDRRLVEDLIGANGLTGIARLVGRVQGEAKRRVLRRARLVCMPSRYETFGISAIEALAAGKPVVATRVPGLAEAAAHGSTLVPRDDPAAFAQAIAALWQDQQRRQELGQAGRASVEGLTWDSVAERQVAFYERALSRTV
jgi:glycosyltransferase involved in cell wall biosynthesis